MQTHLSPGWRRIAAFGLDYGFIVAYLGLLTLVGVLGRIVVAPPTDIATPAGRSDPGQAAARATGPHTSGDRLAWPRSLVCTALKFTIPWELAHTAVWNMLVWPGDRGTAMDTLLLSLANAAIVVDVVSLFTGSRRTPYDRITGTFVRAIRPKPNGPTATSPPLPAT